MGSILELDVWSFPPGDVKGDVRNPQWMMVISAPRHSQPHIRRPACGWGYCFPELVTLAAVLAYVLALGIRTYAPKVLTNLALLTGPARVSSGCCTNFIWLP